MSAPSEYPNAASTSAISAGSGGTISAMATTMDVSLRRASTMVVKLLRNVSNMVLYKPLCNVCVNDSRGRTEHVNPVSRIRLLRHRAANLLHGLHPCGVEALDRRLASVVDTLNRRH